MHIINQPCNCSMHVQTTAEGYWRCPTLPHDWWKYKYRICQATVDLFSTQYWAGHQKVHWVRYRQLYWLYTHLLQKKQNLQLLKCMCHPIWLCVSKAAETLQCNFEYLVFTQCSSPALVCKDPHPHQSWLNPFEVCTDVRYMTAVCT